MGTKCVQMKKHSEFRIWGQYSMVAENTVSKVGEFGSESTHHQPCDLEQVT